MALKKTNTTTQLWQTTQNWLLLLGNKPNTKLCREEISTHPDYPAITSVIDFLDSGNMQYQAIQADASYIHEFNYPLLAHIRQPGQEYMHIIHDAAQWDKQKEITQYWSGITIFPERNSSWKNAQNATYQKAEFKNKVFVLLLIIIGLSLFTASSVKQVNPFVIGFGLFSLIGLIISILLLAAELGYQSQIVKQVCGTVGNGGCEKVLKSKYAKGILGITPADVSVLYFAAQFIFYLLSLYFANLLTCILLITMGGIAIAGWSIYTQAMKLKEWCLLCLGIVVVLILQTTFALILSNSQLLIPNSLTPFLCLFVLCAFLYFTLSPVKQLIKTNNTNQQKLAELKKWKTDAGLFITQWQHEQQVDTTIWPNDLLLGNKDAPIIITVACNPYCGPCAKAHIQLDELLHQSAGKVKVQIRLLFDGKDETNKLTVAVKAILQKASEINNNTELQQMLTDWFTWMDFDKWNTKWKSCSNMIVHDQLFAHKNWIAESKIQFTPTFFISGRKLPGRYSISDIEILIPQLTEILTTEPVK